jgi:hypothetical protein
MMLLMATHGDPAIAMIDEDGFPVEDIMSRRKSAKGSMSGNLCKAAHITAWSY